MRTLLVAAMLLLCTGSLLAQTCQLSGDSLLVPTNQTCELTVPLPAFLNGLVMEDGATLRIKSTPSSPVKLWKVNIRTAKFGNKTTLDLRGADAQKGADNGSTAGQGGYCSSGANGSPGANGSDANDGIGLLMTIGIDRLAQLNIDASGGRGGDGGKGGQAGKGGAGRCHCGGSGSGGEPGTGGQGGRGGDTGIVTIFWYATGAEPAALRKEIASDPDTLIAKIIAPSSKIGTFASSSPAGLTVVSQPGQGGNGGPSGEGNVAGERACSCFPDFGCRGLGSNSVPAARYIGGRGLDGARIPEQVTRIAP